MLARDRCTYFFRFLSPEPIDWFVNPVDGASSDGRRPWFELPDYRPEQGDPRMLWEPARAAWAIDCAKARAARLRDDADSLFWHWVDSWMAACPPFVGFHWKCGQESAVRMVAILLGFWALADRRSIDPERFVQLARLAWATGYRIERHIHYAISQKNNHAISEACGLLMLGQVFPELRDAPRWRRRGRKVLAREMLRQIYPDGSYVQHSMNYQRVMQQMALLALRLAELVHRPFARDCYDALDRSNRFLHAMMDRRAGQAPAYGHNDGAYVLPLSECDFQDFRPVVQATHYLTHRRRLFPPGPWDEDLLWLFGPDALSSSQEAPVEPTSRAFESGGYYTLRRPHSWAMLRSHTYRDRPGQCDLLHLDLWWRGQNVLRDCGTYRYYCPQRPDVEHYFKSIRAHNTAEIDGTDPLELVSRFLWFPWPRGRMLRFQPPGESPGCIEAVSYAYDRPPHRCVHRRTVLSLPNDLWVVIDDLIGPGRHGVVLRWHLLDGPVRVDSARMTATLETAAGTWNITMSGDPAACQRFEIIRGRDVAGQVRGFASPYYGERLPIPTLESSWGGPLPLRVVWAFSPARPAELRLGDPQASTQPWWVEQADDRYRLLLSPPGRREGAVFQGLTVDPRPGAKIAAIPAETERTTP
jgi:hypothetical protein